MKVAIINHKGGVGKTTLAVNIAFRYAEKEKALALIDFDNQCNAMQLFSGFEWNGELFWKNPHNDVVVFPGIFKEVNNWLGDVVFDCPPAFSESENFITHLRNYNIGIDVWIIPVISRTSFEGALSICYRIKSNYLSSRVVLVLNNCVNNKLTQHDRAEATKFSGVELYKQVIPQATCGLTNFEHNGGKSVWEFYRRKQFAIKMRDFCDWVLEGCPASETFSNGSTGIISPTDLQRKNFVSYSPNRKINYGNY